MIYLRKKGKTKQQNTKRNKNKIEDKIREEIIKSF